MNTRVTDISKAAMANDLARARAARDKQAEGTPSRRLADRIVAKMERDIRIILGNDR
jgi:hypothetical protein